MIDRIVATKGLTKRFGDVLAVDGVEMSVCRGEIYGFLGLNGAGKSTTIRMLLGMIGPTTGEVELFGQRMFPGSVSTWRRVGHLVETAVAYPDLTAWENLEIFRRLRGVDRTEVTRRIDQLGLGTYVGRRARTLSLGNLQRLALARALLGGPELLVLDEPANGLDPAGVVEIRELLRSLSREEGVTVFMSSHHLAEVDRLATRIGVVHEGRLIEEIDARELETLRRRRLEVGTRNRPDAIRILRAAGYVVRVRDDDVLMIEDPGAIESPERVAVALVRGGVPLTRLAVVQEDLESHFMRLTRGSGGEV